MLARKHYIRRSSILKSSYLGVRRWEVYSAFRIGSRLENDTNLLNNSITADFFNVTQSIS